MKMGTPKAVQPEGSWAALLAKELAPAKRPAGGKRFEEIAAMRKKAGLPCGETATHHWIKARVREGSMTAIQVFEREESGRKKRRVYYVPAK